MDGHDHHMHGNAPPPSTSPSMERMMHSSFFWGSKAEIVFNNWPGSSSGMYVLALILVFLVSFLVEWLSHRGLIKTGSDSRWINGLGQTMVHALRMALAYMVMLAVMSFNVGMFLMAVAGHALGFLLSFRHKSPPSGYWEGL